MTKKKKLFCLATLLVVIAGLVCVLLVSVNDSIIATNIEALARDEGSPSCTGPKIQNISGKIFCRCENTVPCQDVYGCN